MKNYVAIARQFANFTQSQLAEALEVSQQYVSALESGQRNPGPNLAPKLAKILDVSTAWLTGRPESMPVYDSIAKKTWICDILREEVIPDYGIMYHCHFDHDGCDYVFPVIISDGLMIQPWAWDSCWAKSADDIQDYKWYEASSGAEAIMIDGLPRFIR